MYKPLVSIIIPVYNGANYVEHAIQCALAQTYENIEIIVVNDGSNDNGATDAVVEQYINKIKYFKKSNGGVSSALNFAIEQMSGEWFSWLSHDDGYYPEKIEKEIDAVNKLISEENYPKDKVVIHCANERIDKYGNIILHRKYHITNHESNIDFLLDNVMNYNICGCAVLANRYEIKRIGGFNESIKTVSDAECFYRLLFDDCRFYFLYDVLVQSRQHKKQVGKTKAELFQNEGDQFHIWILNEILKRKEWTKPAYLVKFIAGVNKRGFKHAVSAAIDKITALYGPRKYNLRLKMILFHTSAIRVARFVIRGLYRKVVVK